MLFDRAASVLRAAVLTHGDKTLYVISYISVFIRKSLKAGFTLPTECDSTRGLDTYKRPCSHFTSGLHVDSMLQTFLLAVSSVYMLSGLPADSMAVDHQRLYWYNKEEGMMYSCNKLTGADMMNETVSDVREMQQILAIGSHLQPLPGTDGLEIKSVILL